MSRSKTDRRLNSTIEFLFTTMLFLRAYGAQTFKFSSIRKIGRPRKTLLSYFSGQIISDTLCSSTSTLPHLSRVGIAGSKS